MPEHNFINFHVLISHSPSCLNRDDMNMQKTAVFGGKTRVRISSQSLKRAIRHSDYYMANFSRSKRTRRLLEEIKNDHVAKSSDEQEIQCIESASLTAAAIFEGKTKPDEIKKYKAAKSGHIETQILPFSQDERDQLRNLILQAAKQDDKARADWLKKAIAELEKQQRGRADLDVALSGRMANSELIQGFDGALAVAHAITTHAVEPQDIDWFTAVDDLTQDAGETGAGHLNTQQFSAGVFYRYASLNLRQLQYNLGLLNKIDGEESPEGRARSLSIAAHVLHLLTTVVPSAKQQSFAAHNFADFALVAIAPQPISLANAFERPVKPVAQSGLLMPSVKCLISYWRDVHSAYGIDEKVRGMAIGDLAQNDREMLREIGGHALFGTIGELKDWIVKDGGG
ncbi:MULTISPECIES: type I-E CRISPR-associated protein Cas7/Cse4/CasC [Thiorhodovibrio]|uniref:type I-E CRISPR-associated protein Cas7/Cse4/CasC n=1 Tax=Thiorhodovibrio TaxID=61593 RepID=UPI001913B07F|nr:MULTISPECIES: type I-E CRISPR-associated protein Cas7/Cse4/CasC [Thiorhodovibrio]MBK5968115.1 type I-E CRISPR-associated protein Cas7/Cse4/CasC [Thiorhodovibrio winogradskyi]WPL12704.1 CRISPR system Cascade subunit CasC [Thiorhodovibrio litoralis]